MKMPGKKTKNMVLAILLVLVLIGLILYFNYQLNLVKLDYQTKIFDLSRQTADNLNSIKTQINVLGSNLSSQIGLVDINLQDFKKQNQQQIKKLSNLIDEIEEQSNIKLSELKNELKDIKIKSA